MSMQGEKDKDRAAQVVADFKVVFDKWYTKSRKLREIQKDISKIIYDNKLSYDAKFDCVLLVLFALPKGLRSYSAYELLMDVKFFINTFKELLDLGSEAQIQLEMAGSNILFLFRENFAVLCAVQSLADDAHDDRLDDVVIKVAGEAQKSYKAHLKRDARKQLAKEEEDEDDDSDEGDDDDDDEPDEDEPA